MIVSYRPPVFFEWNEDVDFAEILSLFPEGYAYYRLKGNLIMLIIFARPGYQLQPFSVGADPAHCNVLSYPARQLPRPLSYRRLP
jgi:hypothetical protein